MFYFFAAPMIKRVMEGGYESKTVQIVSRNHVAVGEAIHTAIGRKVIYIVVSDIATMRGGGMSRNHA